MLEIITATFAAGEVKQFLIRGSYFEIIDAPAGPLDVVLSDRNGAQLTRMIQAEASFYASGREFESVQITSAIAQTARFYVGDGTAGTRRSSGSVSIVNPSVPVAILNPAPPQAGSFDNLQKTVTSLSAQLLAAKPARKYLMVQNNDNTGAICIAFGKAATLAEGVKIAPGGSYEQYGVITTQEIRAIGDIASNANIVTVEA